MTKPRVLLVGEDSGDVLIDAALREVAEVVAIPRANGDELYEAVKEIVEAQGPFQVFAVSCIWAQGG